MINTNRIVPVTNIDLLSLYGFVLIASGVNVTALEAADGAGTFTQNTNSATVIANEPVTSFGFGITATAGTVYFVAASNFVGFTVNGTAVTPTGDTISPDATTLYKATLSSGAIAIEKQGF